MPERGWVASAGRSADQVGLLAPQAANLRKGLQSGGQPLGHQERQVAERQLGHDLGGVRVHTDTDAAASARAFGAAAYTTGPHIVFDTSRFAPTTDVGARLLTHELTHVVQQRMAPRVVPAVGPADDSLEHTATRVAAGDSSGVTVPSVVPLIQRQPAGLPDKPPGDRVPTAEVEAALVRFLTRVQAANAGADLRRALPVWQALKQLAGADPLGRIDRFLQDARTPKDAAGLAHAAAQILPAMVPRSAVAHLSAIPAQESKPKEDFPGLKRLGEWRPKSAADVIGAVADQAVGPMIDALPLLSSETKKDLHKAVRSLAVTGSTKALEAALKSRGVDDKSASAIANAFESAIREDSQKRRPPATDPHVTPPAPSVAPRPVQAPGEDIKEGPALPIPEPKGPGPQGDAPPSDKQPAAPLTGLEAYIQGLGADELAPPAVRGKPIAAKLESAQQFARRVAELLEDAQSKNHSQVDIGISSEYWNMRDQISLPDDVFEPMRRIIRNVADKLPHHASKVDHATVFIPDHARTMIKLHE